MAAATIRLRRAGSLALVLLAIIPMSRGQERPCSADFSRPSPCAKTTHAAPDPVALLDGEPVQLPDLDDETKKLVTGLETTVAEATKKALRSEIELILIELEASRRHVHPQTLAFDELMKGVPHPSDDAVKREIAAHPNRYRAADTATELAAFTLYDDALKARHDEFFAGLEKRFPVTVAPLDAGMAPAGTLLATAGTRRITASPTFRTIDAAGVSERIAIRERERTAIERVTHDRLAAREAARRGISTDELTKVEVTSKIAPATLAEVKDAWEKFKSNYGNDFTKAEAEVRQDIADERKERAEEAFDVLLKKGHTTTLLFDIPAQPAFNIEISRGAFTGPANAAVTLIEWGDFECPPCGRMSKVIDEVLAPLHDRVRFVFLQFPLGFHKYAWKAAEASLAARAQGKFFPYAHLLYANQAALDPASLKRYAAKAGLDMKKFENDLDNGRFAPDVFDEKRRGERAGVYATPTFFLNGVQQGDSAYTLEGLRAAIERELARTKP